MDKLTVRTNTSLVISSKNEGLTLRSLNVEQIKQFKLLLLRCSMRMGIDPAPDQLMINDLCIVLMQHFGDLTDLQIDHAVTLFCLGNLTVPEKIKSSYKLKFGLELYSAIINAYRTYRKLEIQRLESNERDEQRLAQKKMLYEMNPEERQAFIRKMKKEKARGMYGTLYKLVTQTKEIPDVWKWVDVFYFLDLCGKVPEGKPWEKLVSRVREQMEVNARKALFTSKQSPITDKDLLWEVKKQFVIDWFQNIINNLKK